MTSMQVNSTLLEKRTREEEREREREAQRNGEGEKERSGREVLSDLVVETPKTVPSVFTLTVFLLLNHLFIFM